MVKVVRFLPWEWLPERTVVPLVIQTLVQAVETAPEEYLIKALQVLLSLPLSLLLQTLPVIFDRNGFSAPEGLENPIGKDHDGGVIFFLLNVDIILY